MKNSYVFYFLFFLWETIRVGRTFVSIIKLYQNFGFLIFSFCMFELNHELIVRNFGIRNLSLYFFFSREIISFSFSKQIDISEIVSEKKIVVLIFYPLINKINTKRSEDNKFALQCLLNNF